MLKNENHRWAVIFDIDGTMVDNARYHEQAWIEFGRRRNLGITAEYYREYIHAKCNEHIVRLFYKNAGPEDIFRIAEEKETIYRESFRPHVKEIPGLKTLLDELHAQGIPCAAASNSPEGNVDMVLDELGIRAFFQSIIDRDKVRIGKPNPELFLKSAEQLAIDPGRCIVLEDSVSGFKAAQNAGMVYVAITAGADKASDEYLGKARAVHHDFTTLTPELLRSYLEP